MNNIVSLYNTILNESSWMDKKTIYKNEFGYIKGYQRDDGRWEIMEFVIYPEYRGTGKARELAKFIPQRARLYAHPLNSSTQQSKLIEFYKSIGFKLSDSDEKILERD